jgi:dolichyl-phosphate beta-glucosyltransferase
MHLCLLVYLSVRQGMMCARGRIMLMADADAATDINDFGKLEQLLTDISSTNATGVVVGSRAHLVDSSAVAKVLQYAAAGGFVACSVL